MPFLKRDSEQLYSQYEVNLVVDNAEADANASGEGINEAITDVVRCGIFRMLKKTS